ncbi:hypothetical protein ABZT49_03200 [Methylobacterium sp. EM32]|uniref:hypothetical protein n=1 Tax=Methylobacterium sp. EM32 TaxID=3163481 RepID=UPI0033B296D2
MAKFKITLDTNAIINHFDLVHTSPTSRAELEEIMQMWEDNEIDVAITTRVEADLGQDRDKARRDAMLAKAEVLPVFGSIFRLSSSDLDGADVMMSDKHKDTVKKIADILSPAGIDRNAKTFLNKINDVDHLAGHKMAGRDVFVTDDGTMNKKAPELKVLGIEVMRHAEALVEIRRRLHSL